LKLKSDSPWTGTRLREVRVWIFHGPMWTGVRQYPRRLTLKDEDPPRWTSSLFRLPGLKCFGVLFMIRLCSRPLCESCALMSWFGFRMIMRWGLDTFQNLLPYVPGCQFLGPMVVFGFRCVRAARHLASCPVSHVLVGFERPAWSWCSYSKKGGYK
jgi:hypothetical protein